jgi:hypothetical protein
MILTPDFYTYHRHLLLCLSQIAAALTVGMIATTGTACALTGLHRPGWLCSLLLGCHGAGVSWRWGTCVDKGMFVHLSCSIGRQQRLVGMAALQHLIARTSDKLVWIINAPDDQADVLRNISSLSVFLHLSEPLFVSCSTATCYAPRLSSQRCTAMSGQHCCSTLAPPCWHAPP